MKKTVSWDPTSSFVPWEFQGLLLNGSMDQIHENPPYTIFTTAQKLKDEQKRVFPSYGSVDPPQNEPLLFYDP